MTESGITSNVPPNEGQEETTPEQNENSAFDIPAALSQPEQAQAAEAPVEPDLADEAATETPGEPEPDPNQSVNPPSIPPVMDAGEPARERVLPADDSQPIESAVESAPVQAIDEPETAPEAVGGMDPSEPVLEHAGNQETVAQSGDGDSMADDEELGGGGKGSRQRLFPRLSDEEMKEIWDELNRIKNSGQEIEIEVVATNRGGIVASYRGVEVFVPVSHWTLDRHSAAAVSSVRPGDKTTANVLEITAFETDARRVTATRRTVLRRELMQTIEVGTRTNGRVVSILDFGVFVNIGGVDGLLPASEMSHDRVSKPADLFHKGQEIEVVVKDVDREKRRVYLSRKELLPSPWEGVDERFPAGTIHTGKVVGIGRDGAFIQLEPGVDGFLRAGELSWTRRVASPRDMLQKGEEIQVKVLDVSARRQRVSLSYRQAQDDPWPKLAETYAVGTAWEGTVSSISNKGVVIAIDEVEGFLPRSRMGRESRRLPEMKVGEKLQVNVLEIDPANHSLIFGLATAEGESSNQEGRGRRGGGRGEGRADRRGGDDRQRMAAVQPVNELKSSDTVTNFALGDLITDAIRERLRLSEDHSSESGLSQLAEDEPHQENTVIDSGQSAEHAGASADPNDPNPTMGESVDASPESPDSVVDQTESTQTESPDLPAGIHQPQASESSHDDLGSRSTSDGASNEEDEQVS